MDDVMGNGNLTVANKPREDILVSICFSDLPPTEEAFTALRNLAHRLDLRFRFREIILIVDDNGHEVYLPLVKQIADLRLFTIRPGNSYYERRVIAAEEAIGDIVIVGNYEEMAHIDLLEMIEQSGSQKVILLATRSIRHSVRGGLSAPLTALGRAAGFKVNLNDLQTIALPRTQLNQILKHSDPELALRFPPRDPRLPLSFFSVENNVPFNSGFNQLKRRAQLLQKLLVYLAPILLLLVSLSSSILTFLGIGYAIYVVGVWVLLDNLAAGWLTTSAMLSLSATFMGISILGLSLGLQQVLYNRSKNNLEKIAHEINRIDIFGKVASDLNVDLDRDVPHTVNDRT
jgi:hypothetical protein